MIEDREIDCRGRTGQLARRSAFGTARPWIAARMIVLQHNSGAAKSRRIGNNLANRHADRFRLPVTIIEMKEAGCLVDMGDPEAFAAAVIGFEARSEKRREAPRLLRSAGASAR